VADDGEIRAEGGERFRLVAPVIRVCLSFTAQQSKAMAMRG
jgi:hypothetical protein